MHRSGSVLVFAAIAFTLVACTSDNGISSGTGGSTIPPGTPGTGGALGYGGGTGPVGPVGTGGAMGADASVAPVGTGGATVIGVDGATVVGTGGAIVGTGGAITGMGGNPIIKYDAAAGGAVGGASGGAGGAVGSVGCDKDLSGTWDLFATSVGTGIVRGVLIASKDGFSLSTSTAELTFDAQAPSATWKYSGSYYWEPNPTTRVISVQSTPAAVNTGSFPIAIGGHWVLQSASETCTLDVAADKVTGKCTGRASDHNVGGEDWPWEVMPSPENRLNYTIARADAVATASQFGDFGGNWSARSDSGSGQGCTLKLEGNKVSTSCRASNSFNGELHLTIGADCVASGVTPSGLEVSARRR